MSDETAHDPLEAWLLDIVVRTMAEDLDAPHVVLCHDPTTGHHSVIGPFPHALDALVAAEAEERQAAQDDAPLVCRISPLLAPP